VRVFTNFSVTNTSELLGRHIGQLKSQGIDVRFNRSGKADLVVVINCVSIPRWTLVRRGQLIKLVQEPVIRNPVTHLFTYFHSRTFDEIYTHEEGLVDNRVTVTLPCNGTFVDPTVVDPTPFNEKTESVSVIASNLSLLPGHKTRLNFINELLKRRPNLVPHTYGRGRKQQLLQKIDGLRRYRYSIAIENTSSPNYLTEKFSDCIISGTVPLYFGAPNVSDYFPADSFISLPIDDIEECCKIIDGLSEDDYARRVPALRQARNLIYSDFSLGAIIEQRVNQLRLERQPQYRFVSLLRRDGLIALIQKSGISRIPRRFLTQLFSNAGSR